LCAWWMEGRWHWRNLMSVVPIFLMAIAASALSIWTQSLALATRVTDPQWVRTWPERLATAGDAVWFYLGKLLWPHPLITIYPRWQIDAGQWVSYLPLLAAIVILAIFWLKRELWSRACFFAFAYFMAALLPVLGLIDNPIFRFSLVFDHLQYLASIGPLALAGTGLVRFSDFVIPKKPWLQSTLCAGLLLILGMASWQRIWVYQSQETLWTDTLAKNPHTWLGRCNLGVVLFQKGQVDDAIAQYQKALEINPNYVAAHYNLGNALFQKGQLDEAVAQYRKAVEINPNDAEAHINLGNALFQNEQLDEALAQFQKAIEINPNDAETHYNLGNALFQKGQLDEAVAQFQKALEIDPNSFATHYNLGGALFQKGQLDDAITQFQEVLRLKPDFSPAQANLAKVQALVREREGNK
jgi:tetratricopeptide (TPR) repeat protein